jgi:hypothetical protein
MSVSPLKPADNRSAALSRVGFRLQARIRPFIPDEAPYF